MVKSGTLIDASLVAADCRRPRRGEPVAERSDPDASWNAMPQKLLFGSKMHLAVDQGSGLVRQAVLTPAHVSDKVLFLALVQGDELAVYADRGYDGWWYRQALAARGIADGIMAGDDRQRPLDAAGHARNQALGALRRPIERSFGVLSSAGTATAACATDDWPATRSSCSCWPARPNLRRALVLSG